MLERNPYVQHRDARGGARSWPIPEKLARIYVQWKQLGALESFLTELDWIISNHNSIYFTNFLK